MSARVPTISPMTHPRDLPFTLTLTTSDPDLVRQADAAGVDWIGVDIERILKLERQGNLRDARISDHKLDDLAVIAPLTRHAKVFARLNPIHIASAVEIERSIELGASVLMLPYFRSATEVEQFVDLVRGRATVVLLLETAAATARLHQIVSIPGISEIVVGLNDLHLSLGLASHFEVVVSDIMETIGQHVIEAGLRFGFGGLARVNDQTLPVPPDLLYAQYPRLGARSAWLSRSFFKGHAGVLDLSAEIALLRTRLRFWAEQPAEALLEKRAELRRLTSQLAANPQQS